MIDWNVIGQTKVMTTLERIMDAVEAQAKQGSCKTCMWCAPVDDSGARRCAMQSGYPPILFDPQSLDRERYPARCDDGEWELGGEILYECYAYYPAVWDCPQDNASIEARADKHMTFMFELHQARFLWFAINDGMLDMYVSGLTGCTDSLPTALIKGAQ